MERYYRESLGIEDDVVASIGNSMLRATRILSYPIVDHEAVPMGLLSIDFFGDAVVGNDDRSGADGNADFDWNKLEQHLKIARVVLDKAGFRDQH